MNNKEKQPDLHSLLQSQIATHLQGEDLAKLMPFLNAVNDAYTNQAHIITTANDYSTKLIENSIQFDFLLKNSFDIMTIINPNGTVVYQSPAFYRICGFTEEQIVGCNGFEYVHPDDMERVGEAIRMGIENPGSIQSIEFRSLTSNGSYIWFETMGSYVVEENFTGIILNSRDITERKRAQKQTATQSRLVETITRNMPVLIYNINSDGICTGVKGNGLNRMQQTEEAIVGTSIYKHFKNRIEDIQKAYSGEMVNFINKTVSHNEEFYFEHFIFLDDTDGDRNLIGFAMDVTDGKKDENRLKDYYDTLEKTNQELDQFAYIVSHDLKAPLRAISNLSIWIEEDIEDVLKEDTKQNFELLRGRIHRMESLINGILEYSRAGRMKSTPMNFGVYPVVKEIVSVLAPPAHFKIDIQDNMPEILADKLKLEQVFSNFISNAIKYNNNPEPFIKISYSENASHHQFFVEDNGPGIDAEYHEKVFVIFQTLQARDKIESTGVGLAIVKKIIEDAGGRVWVESELGKGSKFCFSLPKQPTMAVAA